MATAEKPLSQDARQGTARVEARPMAPAFVMGLKGLWWLWLASWVLLVLPYFPGSELLPAEFIEFLRSAWYVTSVLVASTALIFMLWRPARGLAALVIIGLLIWSHTYGWVKSQINPAQLAEKAPNMWGIVVQLLQPNIFGQDRYFVQLQASSVVGQLEEVTNPRPVEISEELVPRATDQSRIKEVPLDETIYNGNLTISSGAVNPGDEITVTGTGFRPNTPGTLRWQSTGTSASVQNLGDFTADASGNFEVAVRVPEDPERVLNSLGFPNTLAVSQEWPVGDVYLTDTFWLVLDKVIETIFLALMGTSFAVIISIPLSFLASHNLMSHNVVSRAIYVITRTILNILRSVEVLIFAIIFVVAVGIGPFAGVLALTIHSIASLGKLYSEAIESIDPGPIEAITATGANRLQVIRYAVVPQFIPQFVSFTLYRWDINVRMSTIIGLVGGGGIGYILSQFIGLLDWHSAGTAILMIAIVVIAMDYASAKIRTAVI